MEITGPGGSLLRGNQQLTSKPAGSAATLAGTTSPAPTFTADAAGTYVASLVVNDGKVSSTASTVTVTATVGNAAPVANAGVAQNVTTITLITLDGTASSDADGDPLTYAWTLISKPVGSTPFFYAEYTAKPQFQANTSGVYVFSLVVNDGKVSSAPSTVTVTVSVANAAPVANAGIAQTVVTGTTVTLDGSASRDANGDALTFTWTLTSRPTGSTALLTGATSVKPTFVADIAGTYVASLAVSDGMLTSQWTSTIVTATPKILFESEYNDDPNFANSLLLTDTMIGSLSNSADTDWFKVMINTGGTVSATFDVSSMGFGIWSVYWYDPNMLVMSGRNIGASVGAPQLTYSFPAFTPGTYYLRVRAADPTFYNGGSYRVSVSPLP